MPRWGSHPPVVVCPAINHEHDGYYCQTLNIPEHTGSHVDAPAHIHPRLMSETIDAMPVRALFAPAKVFDLRPLDLGPGDLSDARMPADIGSETTPLGAGEIALQPRPAPDPLLLHGASVEDRCRLRITVARRRGDLRGLIGFAGSRPG